MITDKFGKEFKYLDYVIYLRDDEPILGKIVKIIINKTPKIICRINSGNFAILKKFDMVEIITEDQAKVQFIDQYNKIYKRVV